MQYVCQKDMYILSMRRLLAVHLNTEIEQRIDDKVMSSLVCNRTSELKGKVKYNAGRQQRY